MSETTIDKTNTKPKRRKKQVRRAAPAPKSEPKAAEVGFPGLTKADCAAACNREGCVISGRPYCAHPRKGGLQAVDLNNESALKRFQAARKQLGMAAVERQFT